MTRIPLTRLFLGLALLAAPAAFVGCSEETPKPADTTAVTPAPAAPGAPADAPKTDAPATPAPPK